MVDMVCYMLYVLDFNIENIILYTYVSNVDV
jgi:hypothetical protein